jgi:hypothetical protein
MVINATDDDASIELRDPNTGALFAACPVKRDGPPAVQKGALVILRILTQRGSY